MHTGRRSHGGLNMKNSLRKNAIVCGGHGRGMQTKMSRTTKHNMDRKVDKRRRRKDKTEIIES